MKPLSLWQIDMLPWYVFALYWLVTWLRVERTKSTESVAQRLLTIVPMVLRFLPAEDWIAWLGIALTCLGAALAIWARYCLGQYWSSRVTLKEGHRVIRSGPYAFVRHPIYAGMQLAALGTTVVLGERRGVVAVIVMLVAHSLKALREEALLTKELGVEYAPTGGGLGFSFRGSGPATRWTGWTPVRDALRILLRFRLVPGGRTSYAVRQIPLP
jgi:isoprenylcysteine carboxyl methyltransferase (ICMT) family protein YpbQ